MCGALFCFYFALPKLYDFLLSYNSRNLLSLPNIQEYLDLTRDSMLAFGAIFEMPLLIYFLAMIGMVTHRSAVEVQPLVHRARVHHRRDPDAGPRRRRRSS